MPRQYNERQGNASYVKTWVMPKLVNKLKISYVCKWHKIAEYVAH